MLTSEQVERLEALLAKATHVWMALHRPEVLWGGPYPVPAILAAQDTGAAG